MQLRVSLASRVTTQRAATISGRSADQAMPASDGVELANGRISQQVGCE